MKEGLIHDHIEMEKKEEQILSHETTPTNILQLQMALAEELFEKDHGGKVLDFTNRENKNTILEYWVNSGYSVLFRNLVDGKTKIGENSMDITLEELKRFGEEVES